MAVPEHDLPPSNAPGKPRTRRARGARGAAVLAVVGFAWAGVAVGLRVVHRDEVLPGTRIAGIDLGGSSRAEARRRLGSVPPERRAAILVHGTRRFAIRARDVGFGVAVAATASRAIEAGRSGPLAGLGSDVTALVSPRVVTPVYAADRRKLAQTIAMIARAVDRSSFTGRLSIDPVTLHVAVVPPRRGRIADRAATAAAIRAALRRDDGRPVALPMRTAPGARLRDVQRVARQARRYLAVPLQLTGAGEPLTLPPRRLATVLDVQSAARPRGARVRLGAKPEGLARLVGGLAARRGRPAVSARIVAPAAPVTLDEKLDLSWRPRAADVRVVPGRAGRRVQQSAAAAAIAAAIRANRHTAVLSVQPTRAELPTGAARRVRRLIGTFTTHFICCQPRVTNIRLIARAVDGTVIAPGAQFSLNRIAGPRTPAKGYVPAPFISDGKLKPSVGGGVSQFSTTTYNAAYFAGLDIDFHQPHSEFIPRYPPGREATLDYGSIELLWTNDTAVPVLVRASSTPTSLTVSLYGDNGARRVRAESGPRRPLPGRDFAVTVTRRITYANGRVERQPYTTSYDQPPSGG